MLTFRFCEHFTELSDTVIFMLWKMEKRRQVENNGTNQKIKTHNLWERVWHVKKEIVKLKMMVLNDRFEWSRLT